MFDGASAKIGNAAPLELLGRRPCFFGHSDRIRARVEGAIRTRCPPRAALPSFRFSVSGSDSALGRRIAVWQSDRYWIYEVWIAGRCVVIGCAATRELALRLAELA